MRDFISFLVPTKGISLVDFWLDCEAATMSVAHLQISERLRTKFQLLRELEDRYFLKLTPKVRRHLELAIDTLSNEIVKHCQNDEGHLTQRLGELMFERVQYDGLRRLRSYWLPSWILHWESRLKRCQFLPSGHGGCQLFYIPPKRFKTSRSELQERAFDDTFTGSSDKDINGLPDEQKEEQEWDKEVCEQILAKALSGTGLFGVKENRKVLRESRTNRAYLTATSTLDSMPESQGGGLLKKRTPKICDVDTKKAVFDEILLGSAVSWESAEVFEYMNVSSSAKQRRETMCGPGNNFPQSVVLQTSYEKQTFSSEKSITAQKSRAFRILLMDSAAGGPFQLYLERNNMVRDYNALGFLQSIQELARQNRSSLPNRLRRLNGSLRILRTFLIPGAPRDIAMPMDLVEEAKNEVRVKRYQTTEKVFARLARACLELLLPAWIAFLKYDAFEYANPEVQKMASQISPWAALPPEERRVYARIALEKWRFMERERKLAVKTAIRRQKEEQRKKQKPRPIGIRRVPQTLTSEGVCEGSGALEQPEDGTMREPPSIKKFLTNKSLLRSFQMWLADQQASHERKKEVEMYRHLIRQLAYVIESSRFLAMSTRRVTTEYLDRKSRLAEAIYQTYLQKGASQRIPVANKYVVKLSKEKGRPSSGTFRGIREDQFPDLDPHFREFLKFLADKFGMNLYELVDLPEEDLIELLEAQEDKTLKGATGHVFCRANPTAEDLAAFEAMLASVAFKPLTFEVILFYQFLVNNACRRGETFADQDFIFCIEAVRYQELCRGKICSSVLKKKANCILLTFVDTPFLTKLQVDLPHAFSSILVQQVKRALDAKSSLPPDIYEDAKHRLTQEILPFWAGFRRNVLLQGKPTLAAPDTGTKGVETIFRIPPFFKTSAHRQHSGDQYHTRLEYSLPDLPPENRANMINFSVKNGAQWGYFEEG
ncbi:hypothetical protein CRM22_008606 [Opisthorchis felineus]|uniref:RGS domain-containing protein n=1 Tax=Opisthorchis felineus TaxID=147828 RepID=A0A4S2LCB7_OPIFE|nr:hypothetical protein CRM22_008606 [Opisthorchis felineus]